MTKRTSLFFVSIVGGSFAAAGYWGMLKGNDWRERGSKVPQVSAPGADRSVILEVLEGVVEMPPGIEAQTQQEVARHFQERLQFQLQNVAANRRMNVETLRGQFHAWSRELQAKPEVDHYQQALMFFSLRDFAKAAASARRALEEASSRPPANRASLVTLRMVEAASLHILKHHEEALVAYERLVSMPEVKAMPNLLFKAQCERALCLKYLNRQPEVIAVLQQAIAARLSASPQVDARLVQALIFYGDVCLYQNRLTEAQTAMNDAERRLKLAPQVASADITCRLLVTQGNLQTALKGGAAGLPILQRALRMVESGSNVNPLIVGGLYLGLGEAYSKMGMKEDAAKWLSRGVDLYEKSGQIDKMGVSLSRLTKVLLELNRLDEAEVTGKRVLNLVEKHPELYDLQFDCASAAVGFVYLKQQRYPEAEAMMRAAVQYAEAKHGPDHLLTADCITSLALVLNKQQRFQEAEVLWWDAIAIEFHDSVATNSVSPLLPFHLGQFFLVMNHLQVPREEQMRRLRDLVKESSMPEELLQRILEADR